VFKPHPIPVGTGAPTFADVVAVARHDAPVELTAEALRAIAASRAVVETLAADSTPHYGVSTGFGALATRHIPAERRTQLQRSLIRSHAAGSGPEVEREVVRALMFLRLSTLATGRTGVRPETALAYARLLSDNLTPVVHEHGSLGCSGDLAPLAHCALALTGEGPVRDRHGELTTVEHPITLEEKEGLALINGTDGMLGMLVLALEDLRNLLITADITAAMSVEGLLGTDRVFAADLHALRPQAGQQQSAANLRRRRSTTRSSPPTVVWSPTATSTARPSPTCSTSSRSQLPTWRASPSAAQIASSTSRATTGCRRSWPTTRVWTRAT
jgi:histidine ammonia-lyase